MPSEYIIAPHHRLAAAYFELVLIPSLSLPEALRLSLLCCFLFSSFAVLKIPKCASTTTERFQVKPLDTGGCHASLALSAARPRCPKT